MNNVGKLYDNLFFLNSTRKEEGLYPIHKILKYENKDICSLYEFVLSEFDIPKKGNLLDCGCGVGFGSLLIAQSNPDLKVQGISLSEQEIQLAQKICKDKGLEENCSFYTQSFDNVAENKFDCIIAVESLKHSPNIDHTMKVLLKALRSEGKLIIIEDVGKESINSFASRRQCEDWELPRICTVEDYHEVKGLVDKNVLNMTSRMKTPNRLSILFKIMVLEFLALLNAIRLRKSAGAQITRGGIYQELLYAQGKLDYLILTARKES